jgi:hypothetical protein
MHFVGMVDSEIVYIPEASIRNSGLKAAGATTIKTRSERGLSLTSMDWIILR